MIAVFDEASLRGIDLNKLQNELFTSRTHLRMVADHEWRVSWYQIRSAEQARPEKANKTNIKSQDMVETANKILFNPEQIRIADAIFRKRK